MKRGIEAHEKTDTFADPSHESIKVTTNVHIGRKLYTGDRDFKVLS